MKKVFTSANDVIHLFSQQTQIEARSSNVFFYDKKLYSYGYHYLLGEFIESDTIMIDDSGYSVTTSKHISIVSYATRQYNQFFKSKTDLKTVLTTLEENFNRLKRARKPHLYINTINRYFNALNEFLEWSKKNKFYKNQKSTLEYRKIKAIHKAANKDINFLANELKKLAAKEKRRQAKEVSKKLKDFLNFDIDTFRIGQQDYLRLSKDNKCVETSQGVKISVKECKFLYNCILAKKDIRGQKIGHYNVTSINGTLKVGCHSINIKSVHSVGKQILEL